MLDPWVGKKKMASHPSILSWEIPWKEEPGGLQFMGSQRVRHDLATKQQLIRIFTSVQFSSVQSLSRVQLFETHESQHTRPPCPSPTPGVHSNSCPSSQWCHPAISSSVVPFSSCPQSLPASESFPMSQLFAWGGQSTGASALASFLPKNTQGWSPLNFGIILPPWPHFLPSASQWGRLDDFLISLFQMKKLKVREAKPHR